MSYGHDDMLAWRCGCGDGIPDELATYITTLEAAILTPAESASVVALVEAASKLLNNVSYIQCLNNKGHWDGRDYDTHRALAAPALASTMEKLAVGR